MKNTLIPCLLLSFLTACSSTQTAINAKGTGQKEIYQSSKDDIWPIMLQAVKSTDGTIREQDKSNCLIAASYRATAWSWGEKVALFCEEKGGVTEVEVVSKAALKTNITAVKRAPQLQNEIGKQIK